MESLKANKATYLGLFLLSLSSLAYELVLTRIFSVTVFYHFAFLAVSLAMFGMTVGALLIDLWPRFFEKTEAVMSISCIAFALSAVIAMLLHLSQPLTWEVPFLSSAVGIFVILSNVFALSVPFICAGIVVCLALTRFKADVAALYAADLAGASIACLFVVYELAQTTGPATLIASAVIASLAAVCFSPKLKTQALTCTIAIGLLFVVALVVPSNPFRLVWIKGKEAPATIFEAWNSFSFVRVIGNPRNPFFPVGWGLDPRWVQPGAAGQLYLDIDGNAATYITNFRGDLNKVRYLQFDVTNIVHHLRKNASVLVMGVGGGRDVLSAVAFGQRKVTGVEINPNILFALTEYFGDFSGHLDKLPGVTLVNDEARAFATHTSEKFDIIEISLIDTWAATASGAFALAENSLYTTDAWKIFIDHLTPNGVLTVSRWYDSLYPAEVTRSVALAAAALRAQGVSDPQNHLMLIRYVPKENGLPSGAGIGTLLVCRSAYTPADIATIQEKAKQLNFDVMLAPNTPSDPNLALVAAQPYSSALQSKFPYRIDAPSDDSPYFLQLAKADAISDALTGKAIAIDPHRMQGLFVLLGLSAVLFLLVIACIIGPLIARGRKFSTHSSSTALVVYFLCIGFGFMFVEISQMERLSVFLGHPTYGLSVVLFSTLIFSALGSLLSGKLPIHIRLPAATVVLGLFGFLTVPIMHNCEQLSLIARICVSIALLAPMGFVAGMAFPTGMQVANEKAPGMTSWFWGLNGAASVLGSVLAILISMMSSITLTFVAACVCYALATASLIRARST